MRKGNLNLRSNIVTKFKSVMSYDSSPEWSMRNLNPDE